MDTRAETYRHGICRRTTVRLVHRSRMANSYTNGQWAEFRMDTHALLQPTRHKARAIFPVQPRIQRPSRSSCKEHQVNNHTLQQGGGEHKASYRRMEKHDAGRRNFPQSAVLRMKTETTTTPDRRAGQKPGKLDSWKRQSGGDFGMLQEPAHKKNLPVQTV